MFTIKQVRAAAAAAALLLKTLSRFVSCQPLARTKSTAQTSILCCMFATQPLCCTEHRRMPTTIIIYICIMRAPVAECFGAWCISCTSTAFGWVSGPGMATWRRSEHVARQPPTFDSQRTCFLIFHQQTGTDETWYNTQSYRYVPT